MTFILLSVIKGFFAKAGMLAVTVLAACATVLLSAALLTYKKIITLNPKQFALACLYTSIIVVILFLSCEIKNAVKYSKDRFSKSYNNAKLDLKIKELNDKNEQRKIELEKQIKKRHEERTKLRIKNQKNIEKCIHNLPDSELFKKNNYAAKKCHCQVTGKCNQ